MADAPIAEQPHPEATMIFVRSEGWYPVMGLRSRPLAEQAAEHAALNPGTLWVEDMRGNVLWRRRRSRVLRIYGMDGERGAR